LTIKDFFIYDRTIKQHCKLEIQDLESEDLIQKSCSCAIFDVNKNFKIKRGTPRLVINYRTLNSTLYIYIYIHTHYVEI
jgi:hypothetical protein